MIFPFSPQAATCEPPPKGFPRVARLPPMIVRWAREGKIPFVPLSGVVRFRRSSLLAYLDEIEQAACVR